MSEVDWLSHLLQIVTVTGQLEVRCAYGAPWRLTWSRAAANEIPYHVIVKGRAIFEDPETRTARELVSGDIVLLPHGAAHVLHDGSGKTPIPTQQRKGSAGWMLSENDSQGEQLDLLCGRFFISPPHDRLIRNYLPTNLVARTGNDVGKDGIGSATDQLASLVGLMRMESAGDRAGGRAVLNALSSALFTLVLRAASESDKAPEGLLALAGHPRLAPAIAAMLADPAQPWKLPDLADLCGMSRATFMRHFQDRLGCSALDLLTDLRMSLAANELKKPTISTEAVAETVGYQSVSAFRRVFTERMGMTPGEWRRQAHTGRAGAD
ncbi:cupin domain-containing protein [Rhizobium johnstonii]|jgi:AraC family transcriptional activator of mtrCDE|uniref:AraC family transcriptional regulator n=1 Tax=Rhizobium leguminosarum TaxID=384 RepID=A0ABD7PFX9_RHILE|nr:MULTISPECIES: AraC family transcriptional regulator [Rhizobium]MDV4165970.1 AraC family transcriptional regulator [Rhizobium leguminosarum]MDV4176522.1 AraC family transcriptional regulator [Rhizobium leguminosarum]OAV51106.1 AraC family transcriptional regulator [Rhizobium sp. WYCCWR10014]QIO56063.1 AraC family transcriptional regulator [Rhizobium leguminosarum bv. trifolii]QIO70373.1 AraC family transcriptional regulator [Rhizobium leguminosarum bv. trifolii]